MRGLNEKPIMWVCGIILAAGLFGEARAEDWIGERVFPRQQETPLRYEERVVGKLSSQGWVVRDLGEWIEVRHTDGTRGYLGCVRKEEVVRASEAVDYFTGVIREQPNNSWAYMSRGKAWQIRGDVSIARKDLDDAVRLNPGSGSYNARGILRQELKDYAGAIRDYDEAIRLNPKETIFYNNRGIAKRDQKDFTGAIHDFDEAIRFDPKYLNPYKQRGNLKNEQRDYAGAIRDFDEALRLDPKDAAVYCNRGSAKRDQQDYAGALRDYDKSLRLDPKDAVSYYNRGWTKHILKDYAGAIRDYREAIRLDEKLLPSRNNYAFLLATAADEKFRDAGEALNLAEGVLKMDPANGYGKSAKACALALKGEYTEAVRWEREALEDADFAQNEDVDGGRRAFERIAVWKQKKLWLQP